jgi:hypothetical protein
MPIRWVTGFGNCDRARSKRYPLLTARTMSEGHKVGSRLAYWKWRIRTPGWVFTLECTPTGWTLAPSASSATYWKILDIVKTAVGDARES